MKLLTITLLSLGAVFAQSSESISFRAVMTAAQETTPVVDRNATGSCNILVHVVRDAAGKVISGSIDFSPTYRMSGATTFTAMHIHKAPAGTAGAIVVPVPLTRFDDATGVGVMERKQVQFTAADATILDSVNGILDDPSQFYFNIHTADAPSGAMRGQLQRVQRAVLMGLMSPANENPPIVGLNASGVATVVGTRTVTSAGVTTSGSVIFDVNYTGFPDDTVFTGFHIHFGNVGVNGGVTIDSGISANNPVNGGASGNLRYEFDVDLARALAAESLAAIFDNPSNIYINLHTRVNPGGAIRAQLHRTDHTVFDVNANTKEEVATPPISVTANAQSQIHVYTLRNADGTAPAGSILFDINPRFAAPATITAMHIHDAVAGVNGPVTLDARLTSSPVLAVDGNGNLTRLVTYSAPAAVASLNDLLQNPEKHYYNLHTSANPGGVIRAQMGAPTTVPVVTAAISSVSDITRTTAAPKALMSIYGLNLAKTTSNLDGFLALDTLPKTLNGTSATVGGTSAGMLLVSPGQIIVEVPAEAAAGSQPLVVTSTTGAGASFSLPVLANAPNLFYDAAGGVVTKTNGSIVSASNPAVAGDLLAIYSTGNGQTTPPLATGRVAPASPLFNAPTATVTVGGRPAEVQYSVAAPGYPGLYQTGIRMPTGVPAGRAALQMTVGGTASNTVNIDVR